MSRRQFLVLLLGMAIAIGCGDSSPVDGGPPMTLTSSEIRAARRLFDGAPPVIPHQPLNIACGQCHTSTGQETPPLGFAPANPHADTKGLGAAAHCQQCHVFKRQDEVFEENDFAGLTQRITRADRLYPVAPPVIPHREFMRENCTSCHSGPTARPEIRCTHPQRSNCQQCHVSVTVAEPDAELASLGSHDP